MDSAKVGNPCIKLGVSQMVASPIKGCIRNKLIVQERYKITCCLTFSSGKEGKKILIENPNHIIKRLAFRIHTFKLRI